MQLCVLHKPEPLDTAYSPNSRASRDNPVQRYPVKEMMVKLLYQCKHPNYFVRWFQGQWLVMCKLSLLLVQWQSKLRWGNLLQGEVHICHTLNETLVLHNINLWSTAAFNIIKKNEYCVSSPSGPSFGGFSHEHGDEQICWMDKPGMHSRTDSSSLQQPQQSCQRYSKGRSKPGHLHRETQKLNSCICIHAPLPHHHLRPAKGVAHNRGVMRYARLIDMQIMSLLFSFCAKKKPVS